MIWNISAPLPARRLGILMSTVEPGSLLGPLLITYTNNTQETDLHPTQHTGNRFTHNTTQRKQIHAGIYTQHNTQPIEQTVHFMMQLGSGLVKCDILKSDIGAFGFFSWGTVTIWKLY